MLNAVSVTATLTVIRDCAAQTPESAHRDESPKPGAGDAPGSPASGDPSFVRSTVLHDEPDRASPTFFTEDVFGRSVVENGKLSLHLPAGQLSTRNP